MKKRLQFILVGSLLLPCSTGVVLASNAHCRSWVAQAVTQTTETVVATRRHYSRKVLAAWAVWRAAHPHAKPIRRKPAPRPGTFVSPRAPDMLDLFCDVSAATVDEAITTIMEPIEDATAPATPEIAVDSTDSPGLFTLIADGPTPPDASGWTPVFDPPIGFGPPPTSGTTAPAAPPSGLPPVGSPPSGLPPVGTPPSGDPPTTGSSVPPPPVAVAAEPSSLLLLGTGIVATAGLFRRRKLVS